MKGNPITKTIEDDCQNIISQLTSNTAKLMAKKKKQEQMQAAIKSSPQTVKSELEDYYKNYVARTEQYNMLIPEMVKVRELFNKKAQFEKLKMEVPGEIMNLLIEKVINVKTETYKLEREMQELQDDFDTVIKGGVGGKGAGSKSAYEPNQSLSRAGSSILSAPVKGKEFRPNLMLGDTRGKEDKEDSRFESASNLSMLTTNKNPRQFTDYLSNYETELSKSLLLMDPSSLEFKKRMEELAQITQMKNSFADYDAKE